MRRGIEDEHLSADLFRVLEDFRKARRGHGHHRRCFGRAGVLPLCGGGLRVEVEHQRVAACHGKSRGQVNGKRGLPNASLLIDERDRLHSSSPYSPRITY